MSITLTYAGLLALIYVALAFRVIRYRQSLKVGIGDGGHPQLARAIRVHGNFVEYVPLSLLIIGLIEVAGGAAWALHALGVVLVAARLGHALGLTGSEGYSVGRFAGTAATLGVLVISGIWGVLIGLGIG